MVSRNRNWNWNWNEGNKSCSIILLLSAHRLSTQLTSCEFKVQVQSGRENSSASFEFKFDFKIEIRCKQLLASFRTSAANYLDEPFLVAWLNNKKFAFIAAVADATFAILLATVNSIHLDKCLTWPSQMSGLSSLAYISQMVQLLHPKQHDTTRHDSAQLGFTLPS